MDVDVDVTVIATKPALNLLGFLVTESMLGIDVLERFVKCNRVLDIRKRVINTDALAPTPSRWSRRASRDCGVAA